MHFVYAKINLHNFAYNGVLNLGFRKKISSHFSCAVFIYLFFFLVHVLYLFTYWFGRLFCNNHVNHHINSNFLLYLISHIPQILEVSESVWDPLTRVFQASSSQSIVTLLNLTFETIIFLSMIFHAIFTFTTELTRTILFCTIRDLSRNIITGLIPQQWAKMNLVDL